MNPSTPDDFPKSVQLQSKLDYYLRKTKKKSLPSNTFGSSILDDGDSSYISQLGFSMANNQLSISQRRQSKVLPSLTESTFIQQRLNKSKKRQETFEDLKDKNFQNSNSRIIISSEKYDFSNQDDSLIIKKSFIEVDYQGQSKIHSPGFQSKLKQDVSTKIQESQQIFSTRQNLITLAQRNIQESQIQLKENEILPTRSESVQSNALLGSLEKIKRKIKAVQMMNRLKKSPQKSKGEGQTCIDLYQEVKEFFFTFILQKDIDQILKLSFNLMERCVQNKLFRFFIQIANFLGQQILYFIIVLYSQFFLDIHEYDKSCFFLSQYKLMAEMAFFFREKAEALFHLGRIAQLIQNYDKAIIILKKSLEFAWFSDDLNLELLIYEQLGINYFYMGLTQQAHFYHSKFVYSDSELINSPIRQISSSIIKKYLIHMEMKPITQFTQHFLAQISFPIENPFKLLQKQNNQKSKELCSDQKIITYLNGQAENILEKLVNEQDFENYQLDRPVLGRLKNTYERHLKLGILNRSADYNQLNNLNQTNEHFDFSFADLGKIDLSRRIQNHRYATKIQKQLPEDRLDHSSIIDQNPHKYNISLKRLLATRQKQSDQLEKKLQIIKDQVQNSVGRGQIQVRDKIYLSHSKIQKQLRVKKQQNDPSYLIQKYDSFFKNFFNTLKEQLH